MKSAVKIIVAILATAVLAACSSTRHVPDGQRLLKSVKIDIVDNKEISELTLLNYLRQQPNHKVLGFAKLQLGIYNMSGRDTSKWYNRWIRKLGQEPVLFDPSLTDLSKRQLQLALINRGYNHATVSVDSIVNPDKKTVDLTFSIATGRPHVISTVDYQIDDPAVAELIMADSALFTMRPGSILDRDQLDLERSAITSRLRDKGYYAFNKEFITFVADTLAGSEEVDLTLRVHRPEATPSDSTPPHRRYVVARVIFVTDFDSGDSPANRDTVNQGGITVIYGHDHYLRPDILDEKCFIEAGKPYNATAVNRTYEALSQLGILKYVNIVMTPVASIGDEQ